MTMGEFVRRLPFPVCEVHLHDNDGIHDSHLTLGEGSIAPGELAAAMCLAPEGMWVTVESRPGGKRFPIDDRDGFVAAEESVRFVEQCTATRSQRTG